MSKKQIFISMVLITLAVILIVAFFWVNKKPDETPDIYIALTGVVTMVSVFYGVLNFHDWKKAKKNELIYTQCSEFHKTLTTFSVFIQLTLNYIYGNHELYVLESKKEEKTKEENDILITKINIETYKEIKQQLLPLMSILSSYFQLNDSMDDKYKKKIHYLVLMYSRFCMGVYRPIGEDGIHSFIAKTTHEFKTVKYHLISNEINKAKIENIFNLDK